MPGTGEYMVDGVDPKEPTRWSTIADVAALAGVDRSVVSRLLNGDPRLSIRDTTRQRVLDAIERLGYRPNAAARSLRTARTRTLGLFVPDFANPAYGELIKGAEAAAAAVGCVLVAGSVHGAGVGFDRYVDLLGHGRVDGLLLGAGGLRGEEEELASLGLPWLCVNRMGPGQRRYVILDDERAAALAVEHLLQLGHTRLAHIAGPDDNDSARRRRQGYRAAVQAAGSGVVSSTIVAGEYTSDGGADGMARLMESAERPTAVLVANVASAIGALHTAHRLGVHIPRDVSVIAVHDLNVSAHLVPPLATVRMPLEGLGARAVELLLQRSADGEIREVVREPIDLVLRESTAPPSRR